MAVACLMAKGGDHRLHIAGYGGATHSGSRFTNKLGQQGSCRARCGGTPQGGVLTADRLLNSPYAHHWGLQLLFIFIPFPPKV